MILQYPKPPKKQRKVKRYIKRSKTQGRASYVKKKASRIKVVPLKKLVEKADKVFSVFIRERDMRKCVLCGSEVNSTCGHLIKRGKKRVRWDENNCFCLCSICNFRDKVDTDYHGKYVAWYIERYGIARYHLLEQVAELEVDSAWIREKALQVIKQYSQEVK